MFCYRAFSSTKNFSLSWEHAPFNICIICNHNRIRDWTNNSLKDSKNVQICKKKHTNNFWWLHDATHVIEGNYKCDCEQKSHGSKLCTEACMYVCIYSVYVPTYPLQNALLYACEKQMHNRVIFFHLCASTLLNVN